MGLDTVELIMEVEETFEIVIRDEEAERLRTVGQLYEYILRKLDFEAAHPCLTAAMFYRLRSAVIELFGVDRRAVRTWTPVDELIPWFRRRSAWDHLAGAVGLRLPGLRRPKWLKEVMVRLYLLLAQAAITTWGAAVGFRQGAPEFAVAVLIIGGALFAMLAYQVTKPFAVQIAPECRTMRDMTMMLVRRNFGRTDGRQRCWTRGEIWPVLVALLAEQLGLRPEAINAESRFVDDLGAG